MCQGRSSKVMVHGRAPGPPHPLIVPPVMLPARTPPSPRPDLSLPVRFALVQVSVAAVVVSLILAVAGPRVTAPPGLMVQVATARAGPAVRLRGRPTARP